MLTKLLRLGSLNSSKIKVNQIKEKSYQELVDLVAKRYGNRQFKHTNTAALYQIHHHFDIISPGDWVLDIGAGPQFRWTELALTLAENEEQTYQVIANDKQERGIVRPHCQYISGDFLEEPVRTKIALRLEDRKFDTLLTDVSPEFTGELHQDANKIGEVVSEALFFSSLFLKKGGNFVCKVLHSGSAKLLEVVLGVIKGNCYQYKPSVIRHNSPVYYLIFKGFCMNHNLEAIQEFLARYRGSTKTKIAVVNEYKNKYSWDPVKVLQQKIKNDYLTLRTKGRSETDIAKMFHDDPFINIAAIAKQFSKIEKAKSESDQVSLKKAINKYTEGKLFSEYSEIPHTREQWIDYLETIEKELRNQKKNLKKKKEKKKVDLSPLEDNEIYMKQAGKEEQPEQQYLYIQEDLTGDYELKFQEAYIQREMAKIKQLSSNKDEEDDALSFRKTTQEKRDPMSETFGFRNPAEDPADNYKEMKEVFQSLSDQQFMRMMEKEEDYGQQLRENIGKSVKGARNKFRNK